MTILTCFHCCQILAIEGEPKSLQCECGAEMECSDDVYATAATINTSAGVEP